MESNTSDQNAAALALTAWVKGCETTHPLVEQAIQDKCLSTGTLDELASDKGIRLACITNPVIVIKPLPSPPESAYQFSDQEPGFVRVMSPARIFFEGGEHTEAGNSICLYFSQGDPGTLAAKVPLSLPNRLDLTYGQIVALAGDFYGIPDKPISDGASLDERKTRFTNAYETLAVNASAKNEAEKILTEMETEIQKVKEALAAGQQPSISAYAALGDSLSAKWNVITGGGGTVYPWLPLGRYMKLALVNWDHLGLDAINCYVAGHTVAMEHAASAGRATSDQRRRLLMQAYAMNAFADHFLSDAFATGHIRVPRKGLCRKVSPRVLCCYLLRYMHDEDSLWGLNVQNDMRSPGWHAYGDKRYFDAVNVANQKLVNDALQASVDEVFAAFVTGVVKGEREMAAPKMAPQPLRSDSEDSDDNIRPLFAMSGEDARRRTDVNDLNDDNSISNWWAWSTLWLLQTRYDPRAPSGYPLPPTAAPAVDPNGWQSNQSVPPDWVNNAQVRYAVSFVTSLYESNPGPWSAPVTVMNQAYPTLTGIPTGLPGTLSRRLYRQFDDLPYTYVGEIHENRTTTFVDNAPAENRLCS